MKKVHNSIFWFKDESLIHVVQNVWIHKRIIAYLKANTPVFNIQQHFYRVFMSLWVQKNTPKNLIVHVHPCYLKILTIFIQKMEVYWNFLIVLVVHEPHESVKVERNGVKKDSISFEVIVLMNKGVGELSMFNKLPGHTRVESSNWLTTGQMVLFVLNEVTWF